MIGDLMPSDINLQQSAGIQQKKSTQRPQHDNKMRPFKEFQQVFYPAGTTHDCGEDGELRLVQWGFRNTPRNMSNHRPMWLQ